MKKRLQQLILAFIVTALLLSCACFTASAQGVEIDDHELTFTLPDGYLLLNKETADEQKDIIESLGYTVSSFKAQLDPADEKSPQTFFFCLNPDDGTQISLKSWETDFSSNVTDFKDATDDVLAKAATQLVTAEGAEYKSVLASGMKFIEICYNGTDSGGEFSSVQYVTVRNKKFYSLSFAFNGSLTSQKIDLAWNALKNLRIENLYDESSFDVQTILMIVLIGVLILAAVIFGVVIVMSFVKDIKRKRAENNYGSDYIERRGDPFEK